MDEDNDRSVSIGVEERQSLAFDRAVLTLSAGALALSITFVQNIAPEPRYLWLLFSSWFGFLVSLSVTLCSFLMSQVAWRQWRENLGKVEEKGDRIAAEWTNGLNFVSAGAFIVGVCFLAIFSGVNLEAKKMADEKVRREPIEEGSVPPKNRVPEVSVSQVDDVEKIVIDPPVEDPPVERGSVPPKRPRPLIVKPPGITESGGGGGKKD